MINDSESFQIASSDVTGKVVDGEAVIVHLATGMFYSLQRTGALAWSLLAAGHSIGASADRIAEHFVVERERALVDLRELAGRLLSEGLLAGPRSGEGATARPVEWTERDREPYAPPELVKYTDIGDLLALDPPIPIPAVSELRGNAAS